MARIKLWHAVLPLSLVGPVSHVYAAHCEYQLQKEWATGFTGSIKVINDSSEPLNHWAVAMNFAGHAIISNAWNTLMSSSAPYRAMGLPYNSNIAPGDSVMFGFNATKSDVNEAATVPTLGGICDNDVLYGKASDTRPVAYATASSLVGVAPLQVHFDASQSNSLTASPLTYRWVFEDGNEVTGKTLTKQFDQPGRYPVTLTVSDGAQTSIKDTLTIVVQEPPQVLCEYVVNGNWDTGFKADLKLTNQSQTAVHGWQMGLSFTDGTRIANAWNATVSGENPYKIQNFEYNSTIAPKASVDFGFNGSKATTGLAVTLPTLTGICTAVTMTAPEIPVEPDPTPDDSGTPAGGSGNTDSGNGDGDAGTDTGLSHHDPVIQVQTSGLTGDVPLVVSLDASGTTDPDNDTLSYSWQVDSGTAVTGKTFTQQFETPGTYVIDLTVTDSQGASLTQTFKVTAQQAGENHPPVARIKALNQVATAPFSVMLDGRTSSDADQDPLTYRWTLPDHSTATDAVVHYALKDAGTYTFSLEVSDGKSLSEKETLTVTAKAFDPNQAYLLNAAKSSLFFVSTKKVNVIEAHTFNDMTGQIESNGDVFLSIDLSSVSTGFSKRDERMKTYLFEVANYPKAEISMNVDLADLATIDVGGLTQKTIAPVVTMHGVTLPLLSVPVRVSRLAAGTFMVQNAQPILIHTDDFGLSAGVDTLKDLAKLTSISYSVPVNFTLIFEQNKTETDASDISETQAASEAQTTFETQTTPDTSVETTTDTSSVVEPSTTNVQSVASISQTQTSGTGDEHHAIN